MKNLSWKIRLSIVLSVIWFIIFWVGAANNSYRFDTAFFVIVGILPLLIGWGGWWTYSEYRKSNPRLPKVNQQSASNAAPLNSEIPAQPIYNVQKADPNSRARAQIAWRRLFARTLDNAIYVPILSFFTGWLAPEFASSASSLAFGVMMLVPAIVVHAIVISSFGNSLGKFLFRLKIETSTGRPVTLSESLKREAMVWFFGQGAGIPLVAFFTQLNAHNLIAKGERTRWERDLGLGVESLPLNQFRFAAGIVFVLLLHGSLLVLGKELDKESPIQKAAVEQFKKDQVRVNWMNPINSNGTTLPTGWGHYAEETISEMHKGSFIFKRSAPIVRLLHETSNVDISNDRYFSALWEAKKTAHPDLSEIQNRTDGSVEFSEDKVIEGTKFNVQYIAFPSHTGRDFWHVQVTRLASDHEHEATVQSLLSNLRSTFETNRRNASEGR